MKSGNREQGIGNSRIRGYLSAAKPFLGLTIGISVLLLALSSFSASTVTAFAQDEHSQSSASSPAAHESTPASKEAEGDPNEQFHHSQTIKAIARRTHLSLDTVYWLCVILNFIVIFAILWVILKKLLPTVFRNRTEAIQRRLEEARKASEDAGRRLSDVEARLSRLDADIAQMQQEAEAAARREEEQTMKAAEEERRRIVESAEQEIASAAATARRDLKAYTAELAVRLAEKKIQISENTDEKLVRSFASRLGKDGN